ncbi:hypothetical protein TNCT_78631 [Trichonephila clavata]|uniref:Uncharacterized protein n=1 Tax=Trichonephila clavata TaxID=2740835 RepID=A0A8X6KRI0_TRICU|nr:hypothetical protein TNCT_78631 [Trichonephila clavata]
MVFLLNKQPYKRALMSNCQQIERGVQLLCKELSLRLILREHKALSYWVARGITQLWSKVTALVKGHSFGQRSQLWSKVTALVKGHSFRQRSQLSSKFTAFVEGHSFRQRSQLWSKLTALVEGLRFGQRSQLPLKVTALVKGHSSGQSSQLWTKVIVLSWSQPPLVLSEQKSI